MKRRHAFLAGMVAFLCLISVWGNAAMAEQTVNYPFPMHVDYADGVILPMSNREDMDNDVRKLYDEWKAKYLKASPYDGDQIYVHWYGDEGITVSEAHGYGMLVLAYMAGYDSDAQTLFDGMVRYYLAHPSEIVPALMAWQQDDDGGKIIDINGVDSATDGDLDIAYALLLADKQWGSGGELDYLALAKRSIEGSMDGVVDQKNWVLLIGDWAKGAGADSRAKTRPSDFMLGHFMAFAKATEDDRWSLLSDSIEKAVKDLVSGYSPNAGLLPNFAMRKGDSFVPEEGSVYSWDACRVPWRMATLRITHGDTRFDGELAILNGWALDASGGKPGSLCCGYALDGTPLVSYLDPAFSAPFMVAAMLNTENPDFLRSMWFYNLRGSTASGGYYDNTIRLLCFILASGNWWCPDLV